MFVDCHTPADLQAPLPPVFEALPPIEAHSGDNGAVPRSALKEWMP